MRDDTTINRKWIISFLDIPNLVINNQRLDSHPFWSYFIRIIFISTHPTYINYSIRHSSLIHSIIHAFIHSFIHVQAGIWMNSGDQAGSVMAALVWILMLYSAVTVTSLTITEGIPPILGMIYTILVSLALSCHAKTSLTDPGSVPKNAVPLESQRRDSTSHSMCGQCQTFKPPMSHHCRICNRCVSRMDHHCPWMNNCVGAANLSKLVGCVFF